MKDSETIRGSPRLLFTKEELETPELEKPIAKVQKAQKQYDSAKKKLTKRRHVSNENTHAGAEEIVSAPSSGSANPDSRMPESADNQFFHREARKIDRSERDTTSPETGKKNADTKDASKKAAHKTSYETHSKSAEKPGESIASRVKDAKAAAPLFPLPLVLPPRKHPGWSLRKPSRNGLQR